MHVCSAYQAPLRRLTVFTRGYSKSSPAPPLRVQVRGEGGAVVAEFDIAFFIIGDNTRRQGYATPVVAGTQLSYHLSLRGQQAEIPEDWIIEFSDPVFGNRWPGSDSNRLRLTVQGRTCPAVTDVHHDRLFIFAGILFRNILNFVIYHLPAGPCTILPKT